MPRTRLLLLRHGQTDDNVRRIFQGQNGAGLDDLGREQAALVAARLKRSGRTFAALYASDLLRAHETALTIATHLTMSIVPEPRLREVNVGTWSGQSFDEIARQFPDEWAAWKAGIDAPRGGGESYRELAQRITSVLRDIAERHVDQTVLVVSHGAAIRSFCATVLGLPAQGIPSFSGVTNTGVSTVEHDERGFRLTGFNDTSHLDHMPDPSL